MKTLEEIKQTKTQDNIINGIMKTNGLYCLTARPKVGKSFLALQIANSIATGEEFLNYKVLSSPVLYISTELTASQIKERIEITQYQFTNDNFFLIEKEKDNRLSINDDLLLELQEFVNKKNGKFVIIDMLYGIDFGFGYDINNYQDMGQLIFPKLKKLCQEYNITILIIHHLGKNGTSLGSTAIDTSVDGILSLKEDEHIKNRYYFSTTNRDFVNFEIILEKTKNLRFIEIKNEIEELDINLQLFLNYAIKQQEFSFTSSEITSTLKLLITPTKFGRLLNDNLERLNKEGLSITPCRTGKERLYKAKYEEPNYENN